MSGYQKEKRLVLDYYQALDSATDTRITEVLDNFHIKKLHMACVSSFWIAN